MSLLKAEPLSDDDVLQLKFLENFISFIYEDFVAIGLQYFYFEKYTFQSGDSFVYFNAVFMIFKTLSYVTTEVMKLKRIWTANKKTRRVSTLIYSVFASFFGVNLTLYPIARAAGAFYQSARNNAIVNVSNAKNWKIMVTNITYMYLYRYDILKLMWRT